MNVKDANHLPDEIREWFDQYNEQTVWWHSLGHDRNKPAPTIEPLQVHFFHKADMSRVEAWLTCLKRQGFKDKNPWRKHHTEHYWCWVLHES